jgi:hypothetical protein
MHRLGFADDVRGAADLPIGGQDQPGRSAPRPTEPLDLRLLTTTLGATSFAMVSTSSRGALGARVDDLDSQCRRLAERR